MAGVQASVQKKPDTSSLALTVHSLLVVDALQSYGQDFELLVASHHNVQYAGFTSVVELCDIMCERVSVCILLVLLSSSCYSATPHSKKTFQCAHAFLILSRRLSFL